MKILLFIPVFRRPEILRMFVTHMERALPAYAELLPYFVISSKDDQFITQIKQVISGYDYFDTDNQPHGRKRNRALENALNFDWDYMMEMGSDDIWTPQLWRIYHPYLTTGNPYFGLKNIYFYNSITDRAAFVEDFHLNHFDQVSAIGPGRCTRRDVVEQCIPLWPDAAPFGLDNHSNEKVLRAGFPETVINAGGTPLICDVKGGTCLTPWEDIDERGVHIEAEWLKSVFGLNEFASDITSASGFHDQVINVWRETRTMGEAFEIVNRAHEDKTGEKRYSNYASYRNSVSKKIRHGN